ncbi:glycoside hydrolase family 18 protein [Chitinilyticum piscinae]|uniref:chitinase n=1 Tax=Chitinilyticum piscinae TaxID=2866724 RepID=A0A8J7K8S1_9NEIS|nr:glycoside hydrolase family 18 protein [Chitinilyticum piscinae]MBE9610033.1 glycoside hydrolase family 18 protein [Chitinilyticum piscinae]
MSKPVLLAYVASNRLSDVQVIPAEKLTHLCLAFAQVVDGEVVFAEHEPGDAAHREAICRALPALKTRNPGLQTLLSIGGWSADGFSDAALTAASRARFARSAVEFMHARGFDGIDMDWEYPSNDMASIKARPEDRQNFTLMLRELRRELTALAAREQRNAPYLLTAAVGVEQFYLDGVEMAAVAAELDLVNMMTYDLYNGWAVKAGHHSPLYASRRDPQGWSATDGIELFVRAGVPVEKMVLGGAFYGRGLHGVANVDGGHGQPGTPKSNTSHSYTSIVNELIPSGRYTRYWDADAKAPWLFDGEHYISYDDPESLAWKCRYARARGLAGVFFWELMEDATGELLDTLVKGMAGQG